jgi:hypothetical protein
MAGYEWFKGQTVTFGIAHNIESAEEKVDILKSERSMKEDLSVLSIGSVSSAVGLTLFPMDPNGFVGWIFLRDLYRTKTSEIFSPSRIFEGPLKHENYSESTRV